MCVHEKFTYTIRLCHKSQVPKFLIRPQGTIQLYENTFFFLSSVNTTQSRMTFILEFVEQLPYTQNCTHHTSNVHARLQWQQQQLAPNCTQNQNLKILRPNVFVSTAQQTKCICPTSAAAVYCFTFVSVANCSAPSYPSNICDLCLSSL